MKIVLAEACQNTFLIVDCLDRAQIDEQVLQTAHQRLKEEGRDDALILVDAHTDAKTISVQMLVFGLDGTFGEYCANGARACAAYLFKRYGDHRQLFLRTGDFLHRLSRIGDHLFSVTMPPVLFQRNQKFVTTRDLPSPFLYVEAIEPHLVMEKNLSDEELLAMGRHLNQQKDLFPLGINLNAYHRLANGSIAVKTYERGVQRLTKSCGTGAICCAASLERSGLIHVLTPGGPLQIIFREKEVEICGEGKCDDDPL